MESLRNANINFFSRIYIDHSRRSSFILVVLIFVFVSSMASEKSNVPRFYVASKIKNMVKNMPNINIANMGPGKARTTSTTKNKEDEGMHSFHISESQQKPFLDCDTLFTDCEDFLKLANKTIEMSNNKGKFGLSKLVHAVPMTDKISKWRSKRKENDLFDTYDALNSRVEQMDIILNEIANSSATSTSALITQSVHLNVRLTACVEYNRGEVEKAKPLVAEGRAFLNKLKSTEKSLVAMIDFMEELDDLKRNEPQPYVPWALRQQMDEEAEAERLAAKARKDFVELKRESIERRLKKIRKVGTTGDIDDVTLFALYLLFFVLLVCVKYRRFDLFLMADTCIVVFYMHIFTTYSV